MSGVLVWGFREGSVTMQASDVCCRVVTVEYQRMRAKEMTKYFQEQKLQDQLQKAT
jgi:hypothetical protein